MSDIEDSVYVKNGIGLVWVRERGEAGLEDVFYIQTATERVEFRRFYVGEHDMALLYWEAIKKVVNG